MGAFQRKHGQETRDAVVAAYLDRGIRPLTRVLRSLAAGELEHDGKPCEAEQVNEHTARAWCREEEQRRAGRTESPLAKMEPRDAIEHLRVELLNAAHWTIQREKRRREKQDLERLRQAARLVREAAAIPSRNDPRPAAPGQRGADGEHNGGHTTGGLAGQILAAAKRSGTAPDAQQHASHNGDADAPVQTDADNASQDAETDSAPGGQHGERVASLPA